MKKLIIAFCALFSFCANVFCERFYSTVNPKPDQFAVYVDSYDWGPCISKFVLNVGKDITQEDVILEDFEINRQVIYKGTKVSFAKGELKPVDAYICDVRGNKVEGKSSYIAICFKVHPETENNSPFVGYLMGTQFESLFGYEIEYDHLGIETKNIAGFVNEPVSKFVLATSNPKNGERKLGYSFYIPKSKNKVPLILWFHGIGESGFDPYITLFNAKASALAGDKIQSHFKDGVAILIPQCPTGWLETTESNSVGIRYWAPIDRDMPTKAVSSFMNKLLPTEEESQLKTDEKPFAAVSFYTEPVKNLLIDFLESHPEIDTNRIYVGGCSAGGYMTMNMVLQCPEFFAAAFPTCEFYLYNKITTEQFKALKKMPLWFTYAENDGTVNPKVTSIPTIKRLENDFHPDLHTSVFKDVHDTTGTLFGNDGKPYQFDGHSSWMYVLNDQCFDDKKSSLNLFDWLSEHKKKLN
ncbi:MAG: prolyl oligopeptidase family serine peptidase [Treponema sp.]|nr:prolyl oligopeptidase family serine peptidase [Treponema sp.]